MTDTYAADITYTKLAETYKTVKLGKILVAEGVTAIFSAVIPVREKDKHERKDNGNTVYGWMKNKKSAMISCNDGFRPVSFSIEVINEGEDVNEK